MISKIRAWQIFQIIFIGIPITSTFGLSVIGGALFASKFFSISLDTTSQTSITITYFIVLGSLVGAICLIAGWVFLIRFVHIIKNPKIRIIHSLFLLPAFIFLSISLFHIINTIDNFKYNTMTGVAFLSWLYLLYCFYVLLNPKRSHE